MTNRHPIIGNDRPMTCEACHGPTARHQIAFLAGDETLHLCCACCTKATVRLGSPPCDACGRNATMNIELGRRRAVLDLCCECSDDLAAVLAGAFLYDVTV